MSLLKELRNNLQKGYDYAREKGELGARVARLRFEIAGLNRERDAAFSRLGRTVHANPNDTAALEPLHREIERLSETIRDRESVMMQLMQPAAEPNQSPAEDSSPAEAADAPKAEGS